MNTPGISAEVQARLLDSDNTMPVKLSLKDGQPYIVNVEFQPDTDTSVTWEIGRALLKEAVDCAPGQEVGEPKAGDISFLKFSLDSSSERSNLVMDIRSNDGQATVLFDNSSLKDFIEKSYGVVTEAQEQLALILEVERDFERL